MKRRQLATRVGAVVVVMAVVVAAITAVRALGGHDDKKQTTLQLAVSYAPADSQRLSWTDWAGVRAKLGTDDVARILNRGFDADLTSTSALVQSAKTLQDRFGFSPATLEWELFSQSESGAVVEMGLPPGAADNVAASLRNLGFTPPEKADGVWMGGPDLLASISVDLTPELSYFSIDADRNLLLSSDTAAGLLETVGSLSATDAEPDVAAVVAAVGSPLSAAIYTGAYVCNALAMAGADSEDRAIGDGLIARAGEVNPMTGFAIAAERDGVVRVAMSFENERQARVNADSRAALASGPAPGQGGDFSDRFKLGTVQAQDNVVTMALEPVKGSYVLSDLSSGPVLFATC